MPMTCEEAIAAVEAGGRCETSTTIHGMKAPDVKPCWQGHRWRAVACNNERDVIECQDCGEQRTCRCTFDDDFA